MRQDTRSITWSKRMILLSLVSLGFVVACSVALGQEEDPVATAPEQVSPDPTAGPAPEVTPGAMLTPDLGVPVTVQPGEVTIALSTPSYAVGEVVSADIANGLDSTIYTEDEKSDCSIVILEWWDGAEWQPLPGCGLERLPLVVAIGPAQGRTVTLDPFSLHFGVTPAAAQPAFAAGTYRIKFTYRFAIGPEAVEPEETYSQPFLIGR